MTASTDPGGPARGASGLWRETLGSMGAAGAASAVTIPHAIGLGLLAFAPLAHSYPVAALALWSAALPGALLTVLAPRPGVVYAPTTVVALLFASVVALVAGSAPRLGLDGAQVLAVCGAVLAMAFGFQWLFGALRLATLSRFLPISVTQGFAAGVGLSMIVSQWRSGFGAGALAWDSRTGVHALVAAAVVLLAWMVQRRFSKVPGLLPALVLVSLACVALGLGDQLTPASPASAFSWPPMPDWTGVPWLTLADQMGTELLTLALLMAIVNSLEVLVFAQELSLEHGVRADPNRVLRRESLIGVACASLGLIPASTSASRSRIALRAGARTAAVGHWHAALMMLVALSGALWLPWVPMACLAGGLVLAGFRQVPELLWSREFARLAPATWSQGWLVAMVFLVSGGAGALLAGLLVATFLLLHASASGAIRRSHLDGQLRSRRLRRMASDAWLAPRMERVAIFELQGVMSFGVAAHVAEQVRAQLLPRHDHVILDASRVPAWDATALAQLRALAREMTERRVALAVSGLDERSAGLAGPAIRAFGDRDHALEWAEEDLLDERQPGDRPAYPAHEPLGELGEGLSAQGRLALESCLRVHVLQADEQVFAAGDMGRELWLVSSGRITLATHWPARGGLRLATIGQGMAFGEMAFLNGIARTACAGAEDGPAHLLALKRTDFDDWARQWPADALAFMGNLAQVGIRRLAATTRQLRSLLE